MVAKFSFAVLLMFCLSACAGTGARDPNRLTRGLQCPGDTVLICETDSLRGCGCGRLVVLN